MNIITDMTIPSQEFELGRILSVEGESSIVLETMVPMGERTVPFFRVHGEDDGFERSVRNNAVVQDIHVVSKHDDETLYALDWDISENTFFEGLIEENANLLNAKGGVDQWLFELRFQSHDSLSAFRQHCVEHEIPIDVQRLYNPTKPGASPWYGLTAPQRVALTRAVEDGYYSIPRRISTKELADQFDITDQAMTERLRRAVRNIVDATLLVSD